MTDIPDKPVPHYDTAVIGAGPAGCEATIAAARFGARTLCLTINLDTVGFPPANPIMAEDHDDARHVLLEEMRRLGGVLPTLLADTDIARKLSDGMLIADRRRLGLAYKELLEKTENVFPRQALVTAVRPARRGWQLTTRFGEEFTAAAVVVTAGTFLSGEVNDGGYVLPGGRLGEIPANALASSLRDLRIQLVPVQAVNMPRLDSKTTPTTGDVVPRAGHYRLVPDGSQLNEKHLYGPYIKGNRFGQLDTVRKEDGLARAWMTRPSWSVSSLVLAANQVDTDLEVVDQAGLFFAGRVSACCNYTEAAATGLMAGLSAAGKSICTDFELLTTDINYMQLLSERIAGSKSRPVTVRIDEPGC